MERIKSVKDLKKMRQATDSNVQKSSPTDSEEPVIIKVAMATCGIASGAKDTFDYFVQEISRRHINANISQTGCMTYCYAEPTVEVTLPNQDPVVFGHVNSAKAQEIIDSYIGKHELVDGIIPASYKTV